MNLKEKWKAMHDFLSRKRGMGKGKRREDIQVDSFTGENSSGRVRKKHRHIPGNGRRSSRVQRTILAGLLCISTVGSVFAGVQTAGLASAMCQMSDRGISSTAAFEQSEYFYEVMDGYMQLFELYMDISSIVAPEGGDGIQSNTVLLKSGSASGKKDITISELASGKGSGYDYDSYARSYMNDFREYNGEGIRLLDLTKRIRSLKSMMVVEDGAAYYMPAAWKAVSSKDRKELGRMAKKLKKTAVYQGTETFLPDIASDTSKGSDARDGAMDMELLSEKVKAVPQDFYQGWLFQNYPEYAGAYMKTVYADALENGFRKQDGGIDYREYRAGFMRDYEATCFLAYRDDFFWDAVEDDSRRTTTSLCMFHKKSGERISFPEDTVFYLKDGEKITADEMSQYDSETEMYEIYDKSKKGYAEALREAGEEEMKALPAEKKPWKKQIVPCSMEMAQDYARFLVAFYNALQELFQNSQFTYYYDFGEVTGRHGRRSWENTIRDLKNGRVGDEDGDAVGDAEFLFAYYNRNGSVFQTNFPENIYKGREDWKTSLRQAGENIGAGKNFVCAVGVDMYRARLGSQSDQLSLLYLMFEEEQVDYANIQARFLDLVKLLAGALFTMILSFAGLVVVCVRGKKVETGALLWHDRIPLELILFLFITAAFFFCLAAGWVLDYPSGFSGLAGWTLEEKGVVAVLSLTALGALSAILVLIGRWRDGRLRSGSVIYRNRDLWKKLAAFWKGPAGRVGSGIRRIWDDFGELAAGKGIGYAAVAVINSVAGVFAAWIIWEYWYEYILAESSILYWLVVFMLFAMDILFFLRCLRSSVADERLCRGTQRIAQGELSYQIKEVRGAGREQAALIEAINHIGEGLEHAVEESVRNERMKTELITNVSHDIKTPLTSVINYIDLLKREEIGNEKAREYLEVLDAKSQRLKVLIEDLVEASKASSGTLELQITKLNFNELIHQTNGEFAEKFQQAGLQLISHIPQETVSFRGDGRRVYRVLENLYGNVAKYAMPGTRVYVDLSQDGDRAAFTIKNISREQMNVTSEELTERFVRGEQSRSTEGSGLGLSIAKSLTELMQGEFKIYLDGDLFRVTVIFPVN